MIVDAALLMKEGREAKPLYDPAPGTKYMIAPGVHVTMMDATMGMQEEFLEVVSNEADLEEGLTPFKIKKELLRRYVAQCKIFTKGSWPDEKDLVFSVVHRLREDFMYASREIARQEMPLSEQQLQLAEVFAAKLSGSINGETEKALQTK